MSQVKKALIIGGGIGGLAAAIALQRIGIEVAVFERASTFREIGAGLWLWTNAITALNQIGLADTIRATGLPDVHGGIRTQYGETLVKTVSHKAGSIAVHRADLQAALINALDAACIHYNHNCIGLEQDQNGVIAHFDHGDEERGDILIGADGIHSKIRAYILPEAMPQYAGFTAWRAVTHYDQTQIVPGVSWGCGARFGFIPLTHGRVNWFCGINRPEGSRDSNVGRQQEVLNYFKDWHAPIIDIVNATDETAIIHTDIYYQRTPLQTWSLGRVTLLGDAAHAMTPSLGQGACQAIEDAATLAACLNESSDPIVALKCYEMHRIPRTSAIVQQARFVDWLVEQEQPLACCLRNYVVKHMPAQLRERRLAWIFDFRV